MRVPGCSVAFVTEIRNGAAARCADEFDCDGELARPASDRVRGCSPATLCFVSEPGPLLEGGPWRFIFYPRGLPTQEKRIWRQCTPLERFANVSF